jgi:acyl-CoA reductase-like NAD-dependent aldehyde dehydrogenase
MNLKIPVQSEHAPHAVGFYPAGDGQAMDLRVRDALELAARAARRWRAEPVPARLAAIRSFRERLAGQAHSAALMLCGTRSPAEFLTAEIIPLLGACRFLEKRAAALLAPRRRGASGAPLWLGRTSHVITREPYGTVLILGPANYPLFLPGVQLLQALVAGNSVVFKPGRGGSNCARYLRDQLIEAGLPEQLFQLLPEPVTCGEEAIRQGVDKIVLTGSLSSGQTVLGLAASSITPCTLELSGCDGTFIFPDANLSLAAESVAFGACLNSAQTCIAPRRLFVWREIAPQFEQLLVSALARRSSVSFPPQTRRALLLRIDEALAEGADLLHGQINGEALGPVLLGNVTAEMRVAREENWGPLICLLRVSVESEATGIFNRSRAGLGASIFSADEARARQFAGGLNAGSICINDLILPTADPRLPFGGCGLSGFGATRGEEGLLEMTRIKVVSTRRGKRRPHLLPPSSGDFDLFAAFARLLYGAGGKWRAVCDLIRAAAHRKEQHQ